MEELTKLLEKNLKKLRTGKKISNEVFLSLNIEELKRSEISANVIAQNIAWDMERRLPFRRLLKKLSNK